MSDLETLYSRFLAKTAEMANLTAAKSVLEWDALTCLPPAGVERRSQVIAHLMGATHDIQVSPEFADIISSLKEQADRGNFTGIQATIINLAWRNFYRERQLPGELVRETAAICSAAEETWRRARKSSDFSLFQPSLTKIVALTREIARLTCAGRPLYDALLDVYEPGATTASVAAVFGPLQAFLESFLRRLAGSTHPPDPVAARIAAPTELQTRLVRSAAEAMGFDFNAGRLDTSTHPFTVRLHPGDVRITTRYDEKDLIEALTGVVHEAGHGLYEQALPAEHFGTVVGEAASFGLHESQSRLWENMVARGRPFWEFFLPKCQREGLAPGLDVETVYRGINAVQPSFIRVEADEVTYNLHICLRFEIERDLIEGRLEVADVPAVWNAKMRQHFGLEVPDDAHGCLQDTHWSGGAFGYFPSYSLGNLYAAQLFSAVRRDLPGLEDGFRQGSFAPLREWLNDRVHRHGGALKAAEIVRQATGSPPDASYFIAYLEQKYGEIYRL